MQTAIRISQGKSGGTHYPLDRRISHTEPGSVKLFYKKLRADFNAEVDNVFKKLEELSK